MATLEKLTTKVDFLTGDMPYKRVLDKGLNVLESGRRANHEFVFRTNMRTLQSGPNRGKVRVDGAVVVMFGNKDRAKVQTAIVRKGEHLFNTLDRMAFALENNNQ